MLREAVHGLTQGQRDWFNDALLVFAFISTTLASAGVGVRWVWKRWGLPQLGEVVTRVVVEQTKELRVNGGASIKDSMGILLAGQHDMREEMAGIKARLHQLEEPR